MAPNFGTRSLSRANTYLNAVGWTHRDSPSAWARCATTLYQRATRREAVLRQNLPSDKGDMGGPQEITKVQNVLERLHERGMIEARGERRGRVYHMAASLYRRLGDIPGYVRSRGFDRIQQRQMILSAVKAEGKITRKKAAELCQISEDQASRLLRKICSERQLELVGKGRGAYYVLKTRGKTRSR